MREMAKIHVEAYGCSASFADSEMISGIIQNGGHTITDDTSNSDLNVIVTCSVKDATANRMIHRMQKLRTEGPLIVAGCLPKAELKTIERHAGVNASMMGPHSIGRTLDVINSTLAGSRLIALEDTDTTKTGLPKVRLNPAVGIIEIASGCMSECTFCQTKLAKGDLKSYRLGDIVRQVHSEIADGCKEIWLTSTDNGCYGLDIGTDLPELMDAVSETLGSGQQMIRIGMMNPMYMPRIKKNLLESMKNSKHIFKFLHVPVQSGSDRVLHEMARGHTAQTFRKLVTEARVAIKDITISTDIIVGFPSETQKDFDMTVDLLEETQPDVVNLSRYSARPGTEAATRQDQVDITEVKRRSKILTEQIARISTQRNNRWIGWKGWVLFDEKIDGKIKGRNFAYKPILVKEPVKEVGQYEMVEITDAGTNGLLGVIETPPHY